MVIIQNTICIPGNAAHMVIVRCTIRGKYLVPNDFCNLQAGAGSLYILYFTEAQTKGIAQKKLICAVDIIKTFTFAPLLLNIKK